MSWLKKVSSDSNMSQAVRRTLRPRLRAVKRALRRAAGRDRADIEFVHRLRVATRRATAACLMYDEFLPRRTGRWWRKQLRAVRRAAAAARDLDVQIAYFSQLPSTPLMRALIAWLTAQRRAAQPPIDHVASKRRRGRWRRRSRELRGLARGDKLRQTPWLPWAQTQLSRITAEFRAAVPASAAEDRELHRFRLAVKALRYGLELLSAAAPADARTDVYPQLVELQGLLGRLNDAAVRCASVADWQADEALGGVRGWTGLRQRLNRERGEARAACCDWWQAAGPGLLDRLAAWPAELQADD